MFGTLGIRIPQDLAQGVTDAAMADVVYNVNIFDADGVIIASGDPARLGQVHQGALLALKTREPVEIAVDDGDTKTGINLPFAVDGELIGVVGITGPLTEVRPLARLVRTTVSLLVQQNLAFTRQRNEVLAAALASEAEAYPAGLVELALMQGLDLRHPQAAILVDGETEGLQKLCPTAFALPGGIFLLNPHDIEEALARWIRHAPLAVFFVSEAHDLAKDCIAEVTCARVAQCGLMIPGLIHHAADLTELMALMNAPRREALAVLDSHPELVDTLRDFISANMSMSATAAGLHIHRNTLLYRLNRIRKLTGLDPRKLLELITLVAYILHPPSAPISL
ncbi:sugar diacid recognition domain-containing protein [Cryobacterium sp. SO1]|uniref:CdaR family transcriptional regulator n=1 Tax=Cryobacterium sp. SO1 TaxID=1897061 RepID=UPI001022E389|nr:sugar diacid recognition domain-containing protein [Cryobacterium sp. SO1]RZI36903.1 Carbohydrate diacid regulator [Cryobacterium sp. SO1]